MLFCRQGLHLTLKVGCEMMDASSIPHQMGFLTSDLSTWRALSHSISDSSSHPGTILHICFRSGYFLDLRKPQNRIFKRHPAFSKTFQPQHEMSFVYSEVSTFCEPSKYFIPSDILPCKLFRATVRREKILEPRLFLRINF